MKLPFLPIHIDSFVRSSAVTTFTAHGDTNYALYFLSHAHTDHMVGLTPHWQGGLIFCTDITREVLLQKMEDGAHLKGGVGGPHHRRDPRSLSLADRCVPLPLWQRIPLITSQRPSSVPERGSLADIPTAGAVEAAFAGAGVSEPSSTVFVTLIPAFHIPGSVMLYFETPLGRLLYTGDFKFEPQSAAPLLTEFFRSHPVDHVYLDDTWLHLGVAVPAQTYAAHEAPTRSGDRDSGTKVLSKLLNASQVEEAVEAIGRRLDAQRRRFVREESLSAFLASTRSLTDEPPLPYVLRVYLHNQFGKEMLVQKIAKRLGTRAVLDDGRYARVAVVSALLNGHSDIDTANADGVDCDSDDGDDINAAFGHAGWHDPAPPCASPLSGSSTGPTPATALRMWRESDFYRLDLRHFVSATQRGALLRQIQHLCREARQAAACVAESADSEAARVARIRDLCEALPLVEVVDSRADISPEALLRAAGGSALQATPHYGVVMSGWARLQPTRAQTNEVWQVPTTLHCTPQEVIDFIALLKPRSVTPLHYRASRSPAVIMQRLGPHLRRPFVNESLTCDAAPMLAEPVCGLERPARWFALVQLPVTCTLPGGAAVTARSDWDGVTDDGMALLGPRQRGYKIASPAPPSDVEEQADTSASSCECSVVDVDNTSDSLSGRSAVATVCHLVEESDFVATPNTRKRSRSAETVVTSDEDHEGNCNGLPARQERFSADQASDALFAIIDALDS